eukprot:1910147-Pleurochrysis_carterae.AAC.1
MTAERHPKEYAGTNDQERHAHVTKLTFKTDSVTKPRHRRSLVEGRCRRCQRQLIHGHPPRPHPRSVRAQADGAVP